MSSTTSTDLRKKVQNLMHANRREQDGHLYTVPSPDTYPYQWLWDSCFHAIILRHFDIEAAKRELMSLFVRQYDNGMVPHIIYWQQSKQIDINWGKDGVSSITQPPIIALAVEQVLTVDDDQKFLSEIYPKLKSYYDYLLSERVDKTGLAGIINPDESGEDNSPRFDAALGLEHNQSLAQNFSARLKLVAHDRSSNFDPKKTRQKFWVYDVPFNCFLAENLGIMSSLAARQGLSADARRYAQAEQRLLDAVNDLLLVDGEYWPLDGAGSRELRCLSWHVFAPMAAGLLSDAQAHRLVHRRLLNNDNFMAKFGLRTVAAGESTYDPEAMWRGPVWTGVNWWLVRGLRRYGYKELAHHLQVASLNLIKRSGFREYFHPDTGQGYGAHDFTWGGLVLDMLESRTDEQ